ncbi:MAG: OsmC family protein [Planctomycetes bacterium]|nr:OsmC family protein [Planctomycetota bacterium]
MSQHLARVAWRRATPDFAYDTYDRTHEVRFPGGQALQGSAAPDYKGDPAKANPEEMLAAALASCHMLTFLAIAARSRLVVDAYEDEAEATLGKDADGKPAVTKVVLRPRVTFAGEAPSAEKVRDLHRKAHDNCFVGRSVRCEVVVEQA